MFSRMTTGPSEPTTPDLVADVRLYPTVQGGPSKPLRGDVRCPVSTSKDAALRRREVQMQLGEEPFTPGTERRVGFRFLTAEGLREMKEAGHFYLWGGRFIGEATVVN